MRNEEIRKKTGGAQDARTDANKYYVTLVLGYIFFFFLLLSHGLFV